MTYEYTPQIKNLIERKYKMNQEFIKRLKSIGWRFLTSLITFSLGWIAKNLELFELPIWVQGIIGAYILPEITKAWANYQESKNKTFFGRKIFRVRG